MRKLIAITMLGLAATFASAAEDVNKRAIESEVSLEAGYTTLNQANGLGYIGNSAYFSAGISAKNDFITPTLSATYLPKGSESQAVFGVGLEKSFLKKKIVSPTVSASYTRREFDSTTIVDNSEFSTGVSLNNKYITPYVRYFNTLSYDNKGAAVGLTTDLSYKKLVLTPKFEYGIPTFGSEFWAASAKLGYKITSNLTPFVSVAVLDNNLTNPANALDQEIATTFGINFTF